MRNSPFLCGLAALTLLAAACDPGDDGATCEGCLIGDTCYPDGVANPADPCQACDRGASATGWSNHDGAPCDDGLFCNGVDMCSAGACTMHAGSPCGSGLACDEAARQCTVGCEGCLIAGVCLFQGERNPLNPCQVCDASAIASAFTDDDGAPCDDGLYCNGEDTCAGGACAAHAGDPCLGTQECWEDGGGQCCSQDTVQGCDPAGAVVAQDSCEHVITTIMDCTANGSSCLAGRCLCDPMAQTGCPAGLRCTSTGVRTECVPDGAVGIGQACTTPVTGADDCAAGLYCQGGVCLELCHTEPDTCPEGYLCVLDHVADAFPDQTDLGVCLPHCDPVGQDCVDPTQACYLEAISGQASCLVVPAGSVDITQDETCYGPGSGSCYLNGCDKGYGANLPDDTCAFFCTPVDNWSGNVQGLQGDPAGVTCAAQFGGARPDGPGPSYECRFIQSYYSDTAVVAETTGMCVDPNSAEGGGSCADFDLAQLSADIINGVTSDSNYCQTYPERCMFSCISVAMLDSLMP